MSQFQDFTPDQGDDPVFATIPEAIDEIRAGRFVVVADDEGRENEGDLICAAELVTPAMINFMITEARGWVCLALNSKRADELNLKAMVEQNTESQGTAFTVTIDADARFGVTTGISANDRATTIRVAVDSACKSSDLRRPGHVPPLIAKAGGVLQRA
ncbi:MAG: 3,4-dihydroxy-2-butanone-4-phosphate synthase, partial [Candidatus Melainabacteria bacterium]|nr:3,4-dihydroxy-2-butanone-4-phosphate synthase [Candidatus Melainabacteria bacterium]